MSADIALISAAFARLRATPDVAGPLDGRIWDKAPIEGGAEYPYLTLGPSTSIPNDFDCVEGEEVTIQFDVWTKGDDSSYATNACRRISNAVKKALHNAELQLSGAALVSLQLSLLRILDDPELGVTHGVIQFSAIIETA